MKPIIVVHHHEIGLKGKNRSYFEKHLLRNVRLSIKNLIPQNNITGGYGRFIIYLNQENIQDKVIEQLKMVFGLSNICSGYEVEQSIDLFNTTAEILLRNKQFNTIKVKSSRADKNFPMNSVQINSQVGEYLCKRFNVRANLSNPDVTIFIELANKKAYIYLSKIDGAGGLPAGISGRVVSLISAGFDSPVASYKIMKRGAYVIFVHFHSYPYVSNNSIEQVKSIVNKLTPFQYHSKLYLVPFAECQKEIVLKTDPKLRVILYRRMMIRVAEKFAELEKANALITGEALGQVASQTLQNIRVIDASSNLPIFRPLIGYDKEEIVKIANQIGTYEISKEPYDDCCSYLTPRNPETWADINEVLEAEKNLEIDEMIKMLIKNSEKVEFKYP